MEVVNILKSLVEMLVSLVKFLPRLLRDLVVVIEMVLQTVSRLPSLFLIFPQVLSSLLIATFGVVIIYKVMGREG